MSALAFLLPGCLFSTFSQFLFFCQSWTDLCILGWKDMVTIWHLWLGYPLVSEIKYSFMNLLNCVFSITWNSNMIKSENLLFSMLYTIWTSEHYALKINVLISVGSDVWTMENENRLFRLYTITKCLSCIHVIIK